MKALLLLFTIVFASGCASVKQAPVAYQAIDDSDVVVGIARVGVPEPTVALPGAGCLLCIAAANIANSSLIEHTKTLDVSDLQSLAGDLQRELSQRGYVTKLIQDSVSFNKLKRNPDYGKDSVNASIKDHSDYNKYNVDQLLVIDIHQIGMQRSYGSYIPKGPPQASIVGLAYLIDTKTNTYLWYEPIESYLPADGGCSKLCVSHRPVIG